MPAPVVAVLLVIKKLKKVKDAEEQRRRSDEERRHGYAWEWQEKSAGRGMREASYSSMIRKLCQVQNVKQNTEKDQSQRGRGNKMKKEKRQRRETAKERRGRAPSRVVPFSR